MKRLERPWGRPRSTLAGARVTAVALALIATLFVAGTARAQRPALPEPHPDMPDTFKQIIPRGMIASVDEPVFVTAKEAEISDDAWIFGVEIDGIAKAYSLNLLNSHEVINDKIGERSFAAVW